MVVVAFGTGPDQRPVFRSGMNSVASKGVVVVIIIIVFCKKDTQDEHFRGRIKGHDAALDRLIEAGRAGDDAAAVQQVHRRILHLSWRHLFSLARSLSLAHSMGKAGRFSGRSQRPARAIDMQTGHGGCGASEPRQCTRLGQLVGVQIGINTK